jgi:TonB family protein
MASTFFAKNASSDDVEQGIRWLEWAAESGDSRAAFQLAGLYLWYPRFRADPTSEERARKLLRQGAVNGDLMSAEVLELEKEGGSLAEAHRYVSTVSMEDRYVQRVAARELTDEEKRTNSVRPRALKLVSPVYPSALLLTRTKGRVVVEFFIDPTGRVRDAYVISSTHPAFSDPAVAAVKTWRFAPGIRNGRFVTVRAAQTIEFAPNDDRGLDVAGFKRAWKKAPEEQSVPR